MSRAINLSNRTLINDHLRRFPPAVSELTFTNHFTWRRSKPVCFEETHGAMVFLIGSPDAPGKSHILGPPVGPDSMLEAILADLPDIAGFDRITAEPAARLEKLGWSVQTDDDNSDYVYLVSDLAELRGEKYHKKRNLVAQCLEKYDCRYEALTPARVPECLAMQADWCRMRNCGVNPGLCNENDAVQEALRHFSELELLGGVIRVNGRLAAFAIGEALNADTAVWHFEKAMPDIQGLGQLINQWFARHALAGRFTFVNREQDLGLPGLRQAKQSYHPHHMVRKFRAFPPGRATTPPADPHECARHEAMGI